MSVPIRMCIICRSRFTQKELLRLQTKQNKIQKFSGLGRSFYICKECLLSKSEKKITQIIIKSFKLNKNENDKVAMSLKEIWLDGQS